MILEEHKLITWLNNNTNLATSSIKLYVRTIRKFCKHNDLTQDNLNSYIANSFREVRSYYVVYALKYFLRYSKKEKYIKNLLKPKRRPRKKQGIYLPKNLIKKIILNIKNDIYSDMAMLQYTTAARAREIITLKEENIDMNGDVIRIRFEGKGGKERVSFISGEFKNIINKYTRGRGGYIFFGDHIESLSKEDLEIVINNERTYYYNALKESALSLGLKGFGTHDFRRNVAESLRRNKADLRTIQKVLGHTSINTTAMYFDDNPEDVKDLIVQHQANIQNED